MNNTEKQEDDSKVKTSETKKQESNDSNECIRCGAKVACIDPLNCKNLLERPVG